MTGPWEDFAPPAPAEQKPWEAYQAQQPQPMAGPAADALASQGTMGRMLDGWKQGVNDDWGSKNFLDEYADYLKGVDMTGPKTVMKAANEAFIRHPAMALSVGLHSFTGLFAGIDEAAKAADLPPPVEGSFHVAASSGFVPAMAVGEAGLILSGTRARWMNSSALNRVTGGVGDRPNVDVAKDLNVIGPPKAAITEGTIEEAAKSAVQPITAYHGSPYSFDAFSSDKIGTGEGAQSYGYGHYFAENPEVSSSYAKDAKMLDFAHGKDFTPVEEAAFQWFHENGRDTTAAIAAVEKRISQAKMYGDSPAATEELTAERDLLKSGWKPPEGNHYQVRIHADQEKMLDWDKPLSKQSDYVQDALKKLGIEGDLTDGGEFAGSKITFAPRTGAEVNSILEKQEYVGYHWSSNPRERVSHVLAEAGIPGIRYLDQGSRGTIRSYIQQEGDKHVVYDLHNRRDEFSTREEAKAFQEKEYAADKQTRNFVVFNDKDIEITHKNGEPVVPQSRAVVPADPRAVATTEEDAWRARFNTSVSKLKTGDEVKALLKDAADRNDNFQQARTGDIPLAHMEPLYQASGIRPGMIDAFGTGRLLKTDSVIGAAVQMMMQAGKAAEDAAANLRGAKTTENRIAFQEALLRRSTVVDNAVEQYVGLRSEFGRMGNALQNFMEHVKDEEGLTKALVEDGNKSITDLDALAEKIGQLEPREQLPRFLQDMRKPSRMDKAIWYWMNSVLSGLNTHSLYVIANGAFVASEGALVTPMAATIGGVRQLLTGADQERVLFGETFAHAWGMVSGTPQAIMAAAKAVKTGSMTPLPRELSSNVNLFTGQPPINRQGSVLGTIVGAPSAVASGIHTYFRFIGNRVWIERDAYRRAAAEAAPGSQNFWEKRANYAAYPTDATMDKAVAYGDKMTFTTDLGPVGKSLKGFMQQFKIGKLVVPFIHIPANIMKAAQEGTPLAALDKSQGMRDNLAGRNGPIQRDLAWARMSVGSSIVGMSLNWALNGEATGGGPVNKQAHDEWMLTHQPYSVKVGDKWVRYDRTGPMGIWLGLGGDLAELGHDIVKDHEYEEAANHAVVAAGHYLVDETGLQGISDLVHAKQDPDNFGARWAANYAASWMPLSALQGQAAATLDPYLRQTHGLIDAMKYKIPYERETLKPLRDWSGMPIPNPSHGKYMGLLRSTAVNQDPVDLEIERLQMHPTKVPDYVGSVQNGTAVKLGEEAYDEYQSTAAPITRQLLSAMVTAPGWRDKPPFIRENLIHAAIKQARQSAAASIQARYPELMQQGVQQKIDALQRPEDQHKPLTKTPATP